MSNNKIIMYESGEAAKYETVTLTGWWCRLGRFHGEDEHFARYSGSTHRICKNNAAHGSHRTSGYCEKCYAEKEQEAFANMEAEAWSGQPLCIFNTETYFFSDGELADYCYEKAVLPSDLQLVICEPNYPHLLDVFSLYEDVVDDDFSKDDLPPEIVDAAEVLNKLLRESKPVSYSQGRKKAIVSNDILDAEIIAEILAAREGEQ